MKGLPLPCRTHRRQTGGGVALHGNALFTEVLLYLRVKGRKETISQRGKVSVICPKGSEGGRREGGRE